MSGGIAYVLDEAGDFERRCNRQMVDLLPLTDAEEVEDLRQAVMRHVEYTHSPKGKRLLASWEAVVPQFVKVMPRDYARVVKAIEKALADGLNHDDAMAAAFEENARDVARIAGS